MDTQESNKVNATEKLEEVQNELHCSICHDYFVQASTLSCSHSFCFNCINSWRQIHTDCPVCRREILGMAPSRALDNMVAAFVDRAEAAVQANLQQFGAWVNPSQQTNNQNQPPNLQQNTPQIHDSDNEGDEDDDDWEDDEEEEDSYSDGSYDAEEEEYEGEEEEEDQEEEEEEDDESYFSNSDYDEDDDEEYSDDDYDEEHAKRSNQNNPNNDEYWRMRGWSSRPDNWKELMQRQ